MKPSSPLFRAVLTIAIVVALGACTATPAASPVQSTTPTAPSIATPVATAAPSPTPTAPPTPTPTLEPGTAAKPRDIAVSMTDSLRFDPDHFVVMAGETVRFVVTNPTALPHDFTVGDETTQTEHAMEMAGGGTDHQMHGGDAPEVAIAIEPGATNQLVYTFDGPGELLIGCHVPGHYEAGMRGTITIVP